jgi:hypothetical protein
LNDADLEADLAAAFMRPSTPARPDLSEAVMARVRRDDLRRRTVILGSGLLGAGIAAAAVVTAGLIDPAAVRDAAQLATHGGVVLIVGLALTALAAARHALGEV